MSVFELFQQPVIHVFVRAFPFLLPHSETATAPQLGPNIHAKGKCHGVLGIHAPEKGVDRAIHFNRFTHLKRNASAPPPFMNCRRLVVVEEGVVQVRLHENLGNAERGVADVAPLDAAMDLLGDVLRSLSKKKMYGSPNSNPSPELGADKENHTSWERYYQVSDCSSSLRNDWYSGI